MVANAKLYLLIRRRWGGRVLCARHSVNCGRSGVNPKSGKVNCFHFLQLASNLPKVARRASLVCLASCPVGWVWWVWRSNVQARGASVARGKLTVTP